LPKAHTGGRLQAGEKSGFAERATMVRWMKVLVQGVGGGELQQKCARLGSNQREVGSCGAASRTEQTA
jgi:hypothetical protein